MKRGTAALLLGPAVLFLIGAFVGPLALAIGESTLSGPRHYARIFGDSYYREVVLATLGLSAGVTLAALIVGYPYALILARARGWAKAALLFLLVTPLLVNVVVRSFGWMVIFGRSGLINAVLDLAGLPKLDILNSWTAIGIALVHVLLPFMVLSIAATLETLDPALEEAAATLGARPWRGFLHVVMPLSLHGAVTGAILVFALSMGSFVTVMMMGDNRTMVLPLLVYQQLSVAGDGAFAAALGMVLLATVLAVFWLQARLVRLVAP
jgi:ABC-type spermidine/putrescine transport system permease subunit I